MSQPEQFEVLILGSGEAGKLLAWHMARDRGGGSEIIKRRSIGDPHPNIACLPQQK